VGSEKRQKMMLVAVAVLAFGAVSNWFLGLGRGEVQSSAMVVGDIVRQPRAAADAPTPPTKRDRAIVSEDSPVVGPRRPRPEPNDVHIDRKPIRRPGNAIVKKPVSNAA